MEADRMNGFRKELGKFILSMKQPVGYNLQVKKIPQPPVGGGHSGNKEGDAAEECRLENQKLQKIA